MKFSFIFSYLLIKTIKKFKVIFTKKIQYFYNFFIFYQFVTLKISCLTSFHLSLFFVYCKKYLKRESITLTNVKDVQSNWSKLSLQIIFLWRKVIHRIPLRNLIVLGLLLQLFLMNSLFMNVPKNFHSYFPLHFSYTYSNKKLLTLYSSWLL